MKSVLVITYHWPPSADIGVRRWLEFVRELPAWGWLPIVYTPSNPLYPVLSDATEPVPPDVRVIRGRILEPYAAYEALVPGARKQRVAKSMRPHGLPRFAAVAIEWIRGNLMIPDAKSLWIAPSIRRLTAELRACPPDAIVSTGPPHSTHLIASGLQRALGIPWLADFRDPWLLAENAESLRLGRRAQNKHHALEAAVLGGADMRIAATPSLARSLEERGQQPVDAVLSGYDSRDFTPAEKLDSHFTIVHAGTVTEDRACSALWDVIATLRAQGSPMAEGLRVELLGNVHASLESKLAARGLTEIVCRSGTLPRPTVLERLGRARLLLLLCGTAGDPRINLPGKLFDYLAVRRPILVLGPVDGDAARLVAQVGVGTTVDANDSASIRTALEQHHQRFRSGQDDSIPSPPEELTRHAQAGRIAEHLEHIHARRASSQPAGRNGSGTVHWRT